MSRPMQVNREEEREAIAQAIREADAAFGYSFNLTRLVDGIETHTLRISGQEPVDFDDREDGYRMIEEHRNRARADAVLVALDSVSTTKVDLAEERETIARIIDPSRWAVLDGYLADMLRKYKGRDCGYDPEAFKDKASLAKADAILALRTKEPSRG